MTVETRPATANDLLTRLQEAASAAIAWCGSRLCRPREVPDVPQWEYLTAVLTPEGDSLLTAELLLVTTSDERYSRTKILNSMQRFLSEFGADGWELITDIGVQMAQDQTRLFVIFKRPKKAGG
jgi:hypothetical protein